MYKNACAPAAVLLSFIVSGCVASKSLPSPTVDHPANPDALEIAAAPVSNTLAVQPTTGTSQPATASTEAPMEGADHHAH